jgi:16S rRNA G1207 methylase RsmC
MTAASSLEAKTSEQLLLDSIALVGAARLLTNSDGRAQFAAEAARRQPESRVTCWLLDLYQQQQIRATQTLPANLELVCATDPPENEVDCVAWAFSKQGNGELVRDMLQIGHERLAIGGRLLAAIDNPRDTWLHECLQRIFDKVTRQATARGVLYSATKTATIKKRKDYAAEFAFRDGERLIHLRTRPGVFSHRELDLGARSLIKSMAISPNLRVLDLGCGSGAVGVAAALRADGVQVDAIDSNPRAIESTTWAADHNAAPSLTARLDCDGTTVPASSYDLVLANPPYYSHFRIARLFTDIAKRALAPGGTLLVVTKQAPWYEEHLPANFADVTSEKVGNYVVVRGRRG